MSPVLRRIIGPLVSLSVFAVASISLINLLQDIDMADVRVAVLGIPPSRLVWATIFTILVYAILSVYDLLAFHYLRYDLPARKILFTSFVGNTLSLTLGFALLTGGGLRYRFYSDWGFNLARVAKVTAFGVTTFTLCLLLTSGLALVGNSPMLSTYLALPPLSLLLIGVALLVPVILYLGGSLLYPDRRILWKSWGMRIPPARVAFVQLLLSTLEVGLNGAVLYVLLPPVDLPLNAFLGLYVLSQLTGFLSQIPGGLGVFDATMILLLKRFYPSGTALGALLMFRLIFYMLPMLIALTLLFTYEMRKVVKRRKKSFQP